MPPPSSPNTAVVAVLLAVVLAVATAVGMAILALVLVVGERAKVAVEMGLAGGR